MCVCVCTRACAYSSFKGGGRDGVVGIATRYGVGIPLWRDYLYLSRPAPRSTKRPAYWVPESLSPEVKRIELGIDPPPSSAKVVCA
jgi:hypothetical protein